MKMKRGKVLILAVLTCVLVCMTGLLGHMTVQAWHEWQLNRYSVQERLYEAVALYYSYVLMLIPVASLLAFALRALIRTLRGKHSSGVVTEFMEKHGLRVALVLTGILILLIILHRSAVNRILSAVETSEVPAALSDYVLSGRLAAAALVSAEGAVYSFVCWIRRHRRKTADPAE